MPQPVKYLILGPCSLESLEQITPVAKLLSKYGVIYMRAQLYKPRTRPETFQGLGADGVSVLKQIHDKFPQLKFVSEACSLEHLDVLAPHVAAIQVGARNMQNFELLKYIGKRWQKHWDFVVLKRGFASNLEEWISAARYLEMHGVPKDKILLCERGSRSFTSPTGVQLDFVAALAAQAQGFSVIGDPSHGTKKADFVFPLARACLAAGLDGLMIECHPDPKKSVSDAEQAVSLEETEQFLKSLS